MNDEILTRTGNLVSIGGIRWYDVRIDDIAHALSLLCRYGGHCATFYSVAEHSCILHDYATDNGYSKEAAFFALMHDAAEAYVGDVCAPLKTQALRDREKVVHEALRRRFNLTLYKPILDEILRFDKRIRHDEMNALFPDYWNSDAGLGVPIHGWDWNDAKTEFIGRFDKYRNLTLERKRDKGE